MMGLIKKSLCYRVRSAFEFNIWVDLWVPSLLEFNLPVVLYSDEALQLVSNLICQTTNSWNYNFIFNSFPPQVAREILKFKISNHGNPLYDVRAPSKSGTFSIRLAYLTKNSLRFQCFASAKKESLEGYTSKYVFIRKTSIEQKNKTRVLCSTQFP